MDGIGPIDPDLARDLTAAAARNPRSTWCVTVTDSRERATEHGCARPAPSTGRNKRHKPDTSGGPDPPRHAAVHLHPHRSGPVDPTLRAAVHHRTHPLLHLGDASSYLTNPTAYQAQPAHVSPSRQYDCRLGD